MGSRLGTGTEASGYELHTGAMAGSVEKEASGLELLLRRRLGRLQTEAAAEKVAGRTGDATDKTASLAGASTDCSNQTGAGWVAENA